MIAAITELVGRDEELARIGTLLDRGGRALLLEGEPGIGKTALWCAGVADAKRRGFRVLATTPVGSEAPLSFAALRDLVDDVFDGLAEELPPPQRRALAVALLRDDPGERAPGSLAVAAAFLTVLRALVGRGPALLALDDVQWVDEASATSIGYALRRLVDPPFAVLLARRFEDEQPLPSLLEGLPPERIEALRVGPLSIGAVGRLLGSRLGTQYPRPALRRLHEVSGGNPFFALELARALGTDDSSLRSCDPLPVPSTLRELVQRRLAALSTSTLDALFVASALSRPSVSLLGRALGADPDVALAPALEAHVGELDDDTFRFSHPLFAATVYGLAPSPKRRGLHRRLAEVVDDLEERGRHLALAAVDPDEQLAATVENAAAAAFTRGAPAAAADLAAQARRLTPPGVAEAERRVLAEADYRFAAGDTGRASALLSELVACAPPGPGRARLLSRQARLRHFGEDIAGSVELLRQALAEADGDDALRGEIEEGLAWGLLLVRSDIPGASEHARAAVRLAASRGDNAALAEALASQALTDFALGRQWHETMQRALSLEESTLHLRVLRHPSFAYGYCLSCADDLEGAREVFQRLLRRADDNGDESSRPALLNHLALVECLAGTWADAMRLAEEGHALALQSGQRPTQASTLAKIALVAARAGDVDRARRAGHEAVALAAGGEFDRAEPTSALARGGETAIWTLGFVELSLGNADACEQWLGPLVDTLLMAGIEEPGEVRALPDEVEALVALDRLDDAELRLRRLEAWAGRLDRPSVQSLYGRCRGLLLAASRETAAGLAALEDAAVSAARAPLPFERGRTLLALGQVRRRARRKRQAREALTEALEIFAELGSSLWAEKAKAELGRIGGRAPPGQGLTPTERRVAELAAEGKTNREIAAAAFVTPKTVEFHLGHVYAKLGVRSRTELARTLASERRPGKT